MFELFVPYILASLLGIGTDDAAAPAQDLASDTSVAAPDQTARVPEDQTPTGRFTTAGEIRMILSATKTQWINIRPYDGNDLLYFTQLASWRCGLWDVSYGVNGDEPITAFPLEPCHDDTASPNSMTDMDNFLPYLVFPLDSLQSVKVRITYDDGTTDDAIYGRNMVLIP